VPDASPKSVKVHQSTGAGVDVVWKDGHVSHYSFKFLRDACPCATCDDERADSGRELGAPPKPKGALPMYKDPAVPVQTERVGNYAMTFTWNDGHNTGIYTWDFLRALCPCEECKKQTAAS
jgi:DUF971 family protein